MARTLVTLSSTPRAGRSRGSEPSRNPSPIGDNTRMFTIHEPARVEQEFRRLRLTPELLRAIRTSFYKKGRGRDEALAAIPELTKRDALARSIVFHPLHLEQRVDSRVDGATKLLFRSAGGALVETVILRIDSGRTSLCVSSQAGCAAGCSFCATARMRPSDLSAAEILDQVIQAGQLLRGERRRIRNIVFMGMGEPFHNESELHSALEVLTLPRCFNHSERKVLISTVGIPAAMVRCAERFPGVNLALSLHSARQDVRESVIPLAKVYRIEALRAALEEINSIQRHPVMIEYLMLKGLNDTESDLAALVDFLAGLRVHVNLIPYNAIDDAPDLEGTRPEARRVFAEALRRAGYEVTLRVSLGRDISAACGQLVRRSAISERPRPAGTERPRPAGTERRRPAGI